MDQDRQEAGIHNVLRSVDPHKMKASMLITTAIMFISGIILLVSYLFVGSWSSREQLQILNSRVEENASLLNRNLGDYNRKLFLLAKNKNIFWMKNWSILTEIERFEYYSRAMENIYSFEMADSNFAKVYIAYPAARIVLTTDGLYSIDHYPLLPEEYCNELSLITANIFVQKTQNSTANKTDKLLMVSSVGADLYETGFAVLELNTQLISEILGNLPNEDAAVLVRDIDGNTVYSQGVLSQEQWSKLINNNIEAEAWQVVSSDLSLPRWQYIVAVPRSSLSGYTAITGGTLFLSVIVLILAVSFGIMLMRLLYKPFDRLFNTVSGVVEKPKNPNRYIYLTRVFDRLWKENDNLRIAAMHNLPILRDKILMQWVMQPVLHGAEAQHLHGMGIELRHQIFRIAILCHDQANGAHSVELIRSEMFIEFWNEQLANLGNHYIVLFQPQRFFIIINYQDEHEPTDGWENWFNERFLVFRREFECSVTGGISLPKLDMEDLNTAFTEAYESIETQLLMGRGYMRSYHIQISRNEHIVLYPFKLLEQLIFQLRSDKHAAVSDTMESINAFFRSNPIDNRFALRNIYISMMQTLYNALELLVGQSFLQNYRNFTDRLLSAETLREYKVLFEAFVTALQNEYGSYLNQRDALLVDEIKSYIEENYQTDITPNLLTGQFRISTTYLYNIMKDFAGTSPLHYLTHVRMERSAQLLEKTDLEVKQIALQCGIDSEQRFYRNFKKYYGCTPLSYRKNRRTG